MLTRLKISSVALDLSCDMKKLGMFLGAIERGYNPARLPSMQAAGQVWDTDGGPAGRLLIKAARDLLIAQGRGQSAPAFHLHFLCKSSAWDTHSKEVAAAVAEVLDVCEPMRKEAFGAKDVLGASGALGRGALLGSLGLGGGLGALYWFLSRHSNQDDAETEAMSNQVKYYDELARELEDSMRRKYRYDRGTQSRPGAAIAA